jgi:ABC-2 type transport system permease protein
MGFLLVLKAEMTRNFIVMRRYWFATLIGIIIGYGMLVMLAFAFISSRDTLVEGMEGQFGSAQAVNGTLGVLIGMLAFAIVGMFSQGLSGMARSGELEQLYMSPHGLITNFLARSLVASISSVLSMSVMLWLVDKTLAGILHIDGVDVALLILLLAMTYLNLIGFGFMIGGLVLVFKQTGQVATIIRLILIGLAVAAQPGSMAFAPVPVLSLPTTAEEALQAEEASGAAAAEEGEEVPPQDAQPFPLLVRVAAHMLPITDAAVCLKLLLIYDVGVGVLQPPYLQFFLLLIVSCVIWTLLGVTCFRYMERWSRNKGTLGAY